MTTRFAMVAIEMCRDRRVGNAAVRVFIAMTAYGRYQPATGTYEQCFPGIEALAADTGQSRNTVRRALDELKATGWVEAWRRNSTEGGRATNGYRLVVGAPPLVTGEQEGLEPTGGRLEPTGGIGPMDGLKPLSTNGLKPQGIDDDECTMMSRTSELPQGAEGGYSPPVGQEQENPYLAEPVVQPQLQNPPITAATATDSPPASNTDAEISQGQSPEPVAADSGHSDEPTLRAGGGMVPLAAPPTRDVHVSSPYSEVGVRRDIRRVLESRHANVPQEAPAALHAIYRGLPHVRNVLNVIAGEISTGKIHRRYEEWLQSETGRLAQARADQLADPGGLRALLVDSEAEALVQDGMVAWRNAHPDPASVGVQRAGEFYGELQRLVAAGCPRDEVLKYVRYAGRHEMSLIELLHDNERFFAETPEVTP